MEKIKNCIQCKKSVKHGFTFCEDCRKEALKSMQKQREILNKLFKIDVYKIKQNIFKGGF